MNYKDISISWGGLWKIFFMVLMVWILFLARDILIALFLAIIISSALDPIVSKLEIKKIPRVLSALGIYIIGIFILALIIYTIVPLAVSELSNLLENTGKISGAIFEAINKSGAIKEIKDALKQVADILLSGGASILDISSKFLGGLTFTIAVFVLSFYLTVDKDGVERFLRTIIPSVYEEKVIDIYFHVRRKIGRWFLGQIVLSFTVGLAVFIGLTLLGIKYSLILGIVAGIFEIVPYVGPIFSGSLTVLVGLTDSLALGIYALILFIIIQQLESHLLVPAVTHLTTSLNPVVSLVALLIGVKVIGFVGLILAIPTAVLMQEVVESWSASKRLLNHKLL